MTRRSCIAALLIAAPAAVGWPAARPAAGAADEQHLLYVATPGIRNYVEYGGLGLIVYDMDKGHTLVKRFPTFDVVAGQPPENVKGIAASAATGRVYVSTIKRVGAFDIVTGKRIWVREYDGGADRLSISPDGKVIYMPSFEGPTWSVIVFASSAMSFLIRARSSPVAISRGCGRGETDIRGGVS